MDDIKSGSLFKRNINISEELGTLKRTFVPNSVTYTESEIAEEKRRMAKRSTPNCNACPDCPPYDNPPDDGGSTEVPPNVGLPGELPSQLYQSVIGYADNGNPLSYVFPENGKDAWETLYEYMFATDKGRTDFIFIGEDSVVYENNPASGKMVGGFADGFAKELIQLTGRQMYATPIYYGYETVQPQTYDALNPNTFNDGNPTGYGRVLMGTRNVYDSVNNPDGSLPIPSVLYPAELMPTNNDANTRHVPGVLDMFDRNLYPDFYTKLNPLNQFKIYDGGEKDDYNIFTFTGTEYQLTQTKPYNFQISLYFGRRPSSFGSYITTAEGIVGLGTSDQVYNSQTNELLLCPNNENTTNRILSYFSMDSVFNRQTTSTFAPNFSQDVTIGVITPDGEDLVVDYFYKESMKYGLVPPFLGKWYSLNRQAAGFDPNTDDYQIETDRQKIRIKKAASGNYTLIFDPNTNITIDVSDTSLPYLNNLFPFDQTVTNDINKFGRAIFNTSSGILNTLTMSILPSYLFKLRISGFNWANYTTMPGFDDGSLFPNIDPWDIVTLDYENPNADGSCPTDISALTTRYNNTKIKYVDSTQPFTVGMPDAYMLNDDIRGTGWVCISFPTDYDRRVGPSKLELSEQEIKSFFDESKLGIATENTVAIRPYQVGLFLVTGFRIFTNGVAGGGPETFTASMNQNDVIPFGTTYNQQEFRRKNYYYSSYILNNGDFRTMVHNKSRRVKCSMKTGLYMTSSDSFYTKTTKEPIYESNNFKYLVSYLKLPLYTVPDPSMNETYRNSTIALSITPEMDNGTLGTSSANTNVQTADNTACQYGFVDLQANLSTLNSNYTKLNLSFLGYNTENNTEGDVVITAHSGIDCNNTNGISVSVFSNEAGLRFADIEYSWDSNYVSFLTEMMRHIKERQTNSNYGGSNANCKTVLVWLLGRQEAGNGSSSGTALYGGLQGQNYMTQVYSRFMTKIVASGLAPSDFIVLFVSHPRAAAYSKQQNGTGRSIQDPRAYTELATDLDYNDPRDIFQSVIKSIFYPFNTTQNPSNGVLKNKRTSMTAEQKRQLLNSFRWLNPYTNQYASNPITNVLINTSTDNYWRNCLYFDTPSVLGTVNINNRLTDSRYSVEYDINNVPVISYKYLNEEGYLQFAKDMITIFKNGL